MSKQYKIGFQGELGAFSYCAAKIYAEQLSLSAECISYNNFKDLFDAVENAQVSYGMVPIENSSIGAIVQNYDLLWMTNVKIINELDLPIHHHLIGLPGTDIQKIKQIYSHPAALAQCKKLFKSLTNAQAMTYFDTAGSVKLVKETGNPELAAIAGSEAIKAYGLSAIQKNVEDYPNNTTRFVIIEKGNSQLLPETPYKLSLALEYHAQSKSFSKLLSECTNAGADIVKIETRPIPEKTWDYRFFIDLEINTKAQDEIIVSLLDNDKITYKILGRFYRL